MTRYILEKDISVSSDSVTGAIRRWKIVDETRKQEAATLTLSGSMYLAESERLRTSAESTDPFLALRTVLRTDELWIEVNGKMRKVESSDLSYRSN